MVICIIATTKEGSGNGALFQNENFQGIKIMDNSIDFLRDEVRNGFYIPTAIKQAWSATLDVLNKIDSICEKHGIRYFADWGSFLGAVRHGGFIPWDDDLDICMLRDDYDKFRQVADEELPENFVIHDYERKDNHWLFLARVVNNSKMCFDFEYLNEHNNFPWLAGVDIFIKDYLYEDEEKEKSRCNEILNILAVADGIIDGQINKNAVLQKLNEFSAKYNTKFPKLNPDKKSEREVAVSLYRLAEKQMARVKPGDTHRVGQIFPWVIKYGSGAGETKSWYEKSIRLPFENTTIPVPACYNTVLTKRYGDYCTVKKNWDGHNYPFFEGQKKEMEEISGESFGGYKFDPKILERDVPDKSNSLKTIAKECVSELKRMLADAGKICAGSELTAETFDEVTKTVGDIQQLAADLGTLTENVKGTDRDCTVKLVGALQSLCDALWEDYIKVKEKGESGATEETAANNAEADFYKSRNALDKVEQSVKENILDRKEILFLPIGIREWKAFEDLYEKEISDPDTDVYVVPLPLLKKNFVGEVNMTDEEIAESAHMSEYPGELSCIDFRNYDLEMHTPDVVYIQNPYDEANPCHTVPPYFYASNVRKYADNVVYVPIAPTAEFTQDDGSDMYNMCHYVTAPAVIAADKVLVQSENIRSLYIDVLSSFAGQETEDVWKKKIEVADKYIEALTETLGEKADNKSDSEAGDNRKKKLLVCIGANELLESTERGISLTEALNSKLEILKESADNIDVSISLYPEDKEEWLKVQDSLAKEIFDAMDSAVSKGYIKATFEDSKDADAIAQEYDAYYGSPSPFVPAFSVIGKPVMIADFGMT